VTYPKKTVFKMDYLIAIKRIKEKIAEGNGTSFDDAALEMCEKALKEKQESDSVWMGDEQLKDKTKIMVCVFCDIEANDDLGYWSCSKCEDYDGIEEVDAKEYYGE
tara:strand:+ start:56 stop:373 length:318 start_codon:yes stop_codon:yes gene_type:complete